MSKGFITNDNYVAVSEKIEKYLAKNSYDKIIFTKYVNDLSKNPLFQTKIGWKGLTTSKKQEFSIPVPKMQ